MNLLPHHPLSLQSRFFFFQTTLSQQSTPHRHHAMKRAPVGPAIWMPSKCNLGFLPGAARFAIGSQPDVSGVVSAVAASVMVRVIKANMYSHSVGCQEALVFSPFASISFPSLFPFALVSRSCPSQFLLCSRGSQNVRPRAPRHPGTLFFRYVELDFEGCARGGPRCRWLP